MILLVPDSLQQYFFRFLQIGRGIDLPDVAVIDTNGGTPFQNPVINSSMCHVRCTIQFVNVRLVVTISGFLLR